MKLFPLLIAAAFIPTLAIAQTEEVSLEPLTCLLNPNRVSNIGSDRTSIVRNVPVQRAQFVSKGDVLVQLDDAFLQSDKDVAEITHNSLISRLGRANKLTRGNLRWPKPSYHGRTWKSRAHGLPLHLTVL
jgi:multidrug efflux pump subunit AcrA (membrane-fusion protein)